MEDLESSLHEAITAIKRQKKQPYILVRSVNPKECHWLERTYETGEIVFKYYGNTFGCIGKGHAFCANIDSLPFFELPLDSVEKN